MEVVPWWWGGEAAASPGAPSVNTVVIVRAQWHDNSAISTRWQPRHCASRARLAASPSPSSSAGSAHCLASPPPRIVLDHVPRRRFISWAPTYFHVSYIPTAWWRDALSMTPFWHRYYLLIDRLESQAAILGSIFWVHSTCTNTLHDLVISIFIVRFAIEIVTNLSASDR